MLKELKSMTHRLRRTSTSRKLSKRKFRAIQEAIEGKGNLFEGNEDESSSLLGVGPPPYPEQSGVPGIIITENITFEMRPDHERDAFGCDFGETRDETVESEDHDLHDNDTHDIHILEAIPEELHESHGIDSGHEARPLSGVTLPSLTSHTETFSLSNVPLQNSALLMDLTEEDEIDSRHNDSEDEDNLGDNCSIASAEHEIYVTPTGSKVSLTSESSILDLGQALTTTNSSEPNLVSEAVATTAPIRPPRPPTPGLSELFANQYSSSLLSWPIRVPHDNESKAPPVHGQGGKQERFPTTQDNTFENEFPTRSTRRAHHPHIRGGSWLLPISILTPTVYPFEYQFGGLIGEGGFGKVLLALHLGTHNQYAVKVIALRRIRSRREAKSVANEVKVLRRLREAEKSEIPFLACAATMKDWVWQYRGNVHMVLNYYNGGDLGRGLDMFPELRDPYQFKLMVAEVIIAILVLHDMGIVHHDVKPTNILVDSDGHCVLTDYGGSHFLSEVARTSIPTPPATLQVNADDVGEDLVHQQRRQSKHAPILTLRYAAPEVLDGRDGQNIGRAADFWSLGITLFELASGQDLVDDVDDEESARKVQAGQIELDRLVLVSAYPGLRSLLSELIVYNPTDRLRGHAIKSHSYFSEFSQRDWTSIFSKARPPFLPNRQAPINPRNTSYEFVERPGERLLDDADEDNVNQWLTENGGIKLVHHRASEFHQKHGKKAQLGTGMGITGFGEEDCNMKDNRGAAEFKSAWWT